MSEELKPTRLNKVAAQFNVGISTIVEFLHKKGIVIEENPNSKVMPEMFALLVKEYSSDKAAKDEAAKIGLAFVKHEAITLEEKGVKARPADADNEPEDLIIKGSTVTFDVPAPPKEKKPAEKPAEKPVAEAPKPEVKAPVVPPPPPVEEKPVAEPVKAEPSKETPKAIEPVVEKQVEEVPEEVADSAEAKTESTIKVLGKIDLDSLNQKTRPTKKTREEKKAEAQQKADEKKAKKPEPEEVAPVAEVDELPAPEPAPEPVAEAAPVKEEQPPAPKQPVRDANFIPTKVQKLDGPKIFGKIELPVEKKPEKKPVASSTDDKLQLKKKKRKRIRQEKYQEPVAPSEHKDKPKAGPKKKQIFKPEPSEEEIQKQIKETLARLAPSGKSKASKYRRQKRENIREEIEIDRQKAEEDKKILKVTEFVTVSEMANMMDVPAINIISTFMQLGMFVSINQRLNAESLALVAEEFGYKVEFVDVSVQEALELTQEEDKDEDLSERPPIVTVMGHVDHGKTKLLDFIRNTNVVAGEAGGITQHIGAYEVQLESGKKITFLDTPGHEAFTAMRARGALVTDVAIIVIAADDDVMPQTVEAINHAQAGGVPLVFAINKVDKQTANPEKIKEQLAKMNILVEDWGGKYQSQEISAKAGLNVNLLLDKVLLEAEMLELKANPERLALGTVLESSLDKGRGYVAKVLVQNGTLNIGDMVLAGSHFGRIKAMYNERNQRVNQAGPSTPVLLLGLDGAPQAGDKFNVMKDEREAKAIANKRLQLQREQGIRSQKHITLDEIGRRIAIGDFKELNLIVKGDVDGSVEALSDSLLKLSTNEVQVNVIHKSVGQVTESDVLLASASNAIIVGFQVRPSLSARKLAEKEEIEIRSYSIIYQAIEEIKAAIEGMLSPEIEEKITCNIEIRDVFKISKVGTIAGCYVLDGKINRNTRVRLIRNGIVVYTGRLGSLKRFKDDVKEVLQGFECGLNIENFNDIKEGDIIEGFEEVEVKRKL
jgi:translation initiation factor IF-2